MSSVGIKPKQGVAVFALPMPMNGVALIYDVIQRIYGTGESTLEFNGDSIQVNAPADGFGPLKRSRQKPAPVADDGTLVRQYLRGDHLEITVEEAEHVTQSISHSVMLYLDAIEVVNYVEMRLQNPDTEAQFIYTVQRAAAKSPHTLRLEAEQQLTALIEGWASWFQSNNEHVGGKQTFTAAEVAQLLRSPAPFGVAAAERVTS